MKRDDKPVKRKESKKKREGSVKRLKIRETGPLALEMTFPHRKKKAERLAITDPFYPRTELSLELFRSLGTMNLVAPYLPEVIDTDFAIDWYIGSLIDDMYRSCGKDSGPYFTECPRKRLWNARPGRGHKAIVSHSSGKDSLHSVMWTQEQFGDENVMPVHVAGLNTSNASGEREYAFRQAREFGWPHFREVVLKSSARCTKNGFQVMRSRDFFMTGILVPVALQFGAKRIITEGFAETNPDELFTGLQVNMEAFNMALKRMGIQVFVAWKNLPEMDVIREVYERRPGWMEHVHNCFSLACRKETRRRSWERRTPSWPLYDSQCGSCSKCRITRLGQLRYDLEGMVNVRPEEVRIFLTDTAKYTLRQWKLALKGEFNRMDMLNGSFLCDLGIEMRRFGLEKEANKLQLTLMRYEDELKAA